MRSGSFNTKSNEIRHRTTSAARTFLEEPSATVRSVAKEYGVSKSTIHLDLRERLPDINPVLAKEVFKKLDENLADCPRRAGRASALKKKERHKLA